MAALFCFLYILLTLCTGHIDSKNSNSFISVVKDPLLANFIFEYEKRSDQVAWATYTNEVNKTGWSYLEVYTNNQSSDYDQAYAAGLVEGRITAEMIALSWHNTYDGYCPRPFDKFCKTLYGYLSENLQWMENQIKTANKNDTYWHQVALILIQINGMKDGFDNKPSKPSVKIADPLHMMMIMQISGDLEDLESAFGKSDAAPEEKPAGHCSALIKLLPKNRDLYVAQDTWSGYQTMLRILKKYDFAFHTSKSGGHLIPGSKMTFSSYPGTIYSGDDLYVISSRLVTLETTIGNGNASLWSHIKPTDSVLEGFRNIVANRLALRGQDWVDVFSQFNSGTYNNQWMVVDFKSFTPGITPTNGLLYILEQIPGSISSDDRTDVLVKNGYWASYNIAYFQDIFNASGQPAMVKKYGDWFTYENNPRAKIFRRDHVKVNDTKSMIKLMRYNDFQHDPLSKCNCTPPYSGENSISARSDLNPTNGTYPFSALGHRNHGGHDMKLTDSSMMKNLQFISVCGPTYDQQPVFQWSKSDFEKTVKHLGHPDVFKFDPIFHEWGRR